MTECPICYEPEKNWRGSTKAVCGHLLCMTCFITHTKNANNCPLCRRGYLESQEGGGGDDDDDDDDDDEEEAYEDDESDAPFVVGVGMFSNFVANQNDDEDDGCQCPDDECTCDEEQEVCNCPDDECTCYWEMEEE